MLVSMSQRTWSQHDIFAMIGFNVIRGKIKLPLEQKCVKKWMHYILIKYAQKNVRFNKYLPITEVLIEKKNT